MASRKQKQADRKRKKRLLRKHAKRAQGMFGGFKMIESPPEQGKMSEVLPEDEDPRPVWGDG
jgi:hypothetical protein